MERMKWSVLTICSLAIFLNNLSTSRTSSPVKKIRDGVYSCPYSPVTEKYPDPSSIYCEYFFLCHRGHAFPRKCAPLFAFHPLHVACIRRDQIPEDLCPYEMECGFNGYQPDPKDCTKYYLCFYRTPTHYSCTEGKIFDPTTSTCITDTERAKQCSHPTPPPHYLTSSSTTKRSARSISNSTTKKVSGGQSGYNARNDGSLLTITTTERALLKNLKNKTIIVADP